jgi:hypothetical protein
MKDLLEQRKHEEEERIKNLRQQIYNNCDSIRSFIDVEDADHAEELLYQTFPLIKEIKDEGVNKLCDDLLKDLETLKEAILQREVKRREEIARQRAEEEKKKIEKERQEEQRKEEERLRRERQAREYEERIAKQEHELCEEIIRLTKEVSKPKSDAKSILQYLQTKGVRRFYHFTDRQNLNSIRRLRGLYSWNYCINHGIFIPNAGGDSLSRGLDRRQGLEDYVRLSFCNDHPMAYRKHKEGADLVLLIIKIDVASFKDTLFSDRNAASNSFSYGGGLDDLRKVNIAATKRNYVSRDEGEIFAQHQAECMVKTFIPIEYIENIDNPQIMYFS